MTTRPDRAPQVAPLARGGNWSLLLWLLGRTPQALLSRAFGRLAELTLPRLLRAPVYRAYARLGVDLSEVELPLDRYPSLGAFFVRRLRAGARRWPSDPAAAASPVDGIVGASGTLDGDCLLQAKGRRYTAAELLDDPAAARVFRGGAYATIYLSPRHYHRIHSPCGGRVLAARRVPGRLLPVNVAAVRLVPRLFAQNERLVCHLGDDAARIALVAVGAFNVGRIAAAFDPAWRGSPEPEARSYGPGLPIERGAELMAFHLGSTVVVLFESGRWRLVESWRPGTEVRAGDVLAMPLERADR